VLDDWVSRRGRLLPAPASAAWTLEVPPAGELRFASGLLLPELRAGDGSDGAELRVTVDGEGVWSAALSPGGFIEQRVDLARFAGRKVRLAVESLPGATAAADYVFVAAPVVASRQRDPRRVILVFVDTLRPDHLSLYGYGRDTSAAIDALGKEAAVFADARSVAPWTLPAARSIVTGRYPEYYSGAVTLPELLRENGFSTAFLAGNVYLSTAFEMNRDWDLHRVAMLPSATETTDQAIAWLDGSAGRDALLQVHYMSTHLPYLEPPSYRTRYAGRGAAGLEGEIELADVRAADLAHDPAGQRYLRDRYDGAVRWTTDEIGRLLAHLGPGDIVVLFADHGEELWDHGGFEHGHTLYDELLRVPLVVRAPGIPAGRIAGPVSVLDIAPTVLDLLGLPPLPASDGISLVPAMHGAPLPARDLAFGHPLYGPERWGVLHDAEKWTSVRDREEVFALASDPRERKGAPPADPAVWHARLGAAVGRTAVAGWRLAPTPDERGGEIPGLWARCTVPGGFSQAFAADDPLGRSAAAARIDAGAAEVCWSPGWAGAREVDLQPVSPRSEVASGIRCEVAYGAARAVLTAAEPAADLGGRHIALAWGVAPAPDARTEPIEGSDAETAGMLAVLGYVTGVAPDVALACAPP
jgi:hypothetical protein